jgi:hypothetical protein
MFPYGGHSLRRQARYLADRPVGQVRMRRDDPLGGGTAVCLRQWQAMRDVLLYGAQEYVRLAAVEEYDVDCLTALQRRGDQAVHAVDDTHGALVHQYRRERCIHLGEPQDMALVLPVQPRRVGRAER